MCNASQNGSKVGSDILEVSPMSGITLRVIVLNMVFIHFNFHFWPSTQSRKYSQPFREQIPTNTEAYNKLDSSLLGLRSRSMVQTALLKCNTWIPVEWILYRSGFPTICLYSMKWQWPCLSLDWLALCFGQDRQYLNKLWEIVLDSCGPQRANPADFSPCATRRSTLVVLCEISLQLLDKTVCPQLQNWMFFCLL